MSIGKNIKQLRKGRGWSQEELGIRLNVVKSTVSMWECGERTPDDDMIMKIARVFDVDINRIFGYNVKRDEMDIGIRNIRTRRLPMLGNVACGEPIFANEERESYVDTDADIDADFCLTAKGDSMINARIFDGDILFIKQQPMVDDGEIAVVLIDDEATVKRVYYDRENAILTLMPENPTYKPMRYSGDHLNAVRILGKVVCGQYDVR